MRHAARAYRDLGQHPGVPRLLVGLIASRAATPLLNLSLLLATVGTTGSYALGGLAVTGFSVALGISVPIYGRLVDRLHPARVLLSVLTLHLGAYVLLVLALTADDAPPTLTIGAAAAVGATTPPSAPVIRSSWTAVLAPAQVRTGYALDAVLNEVMVVTGTLLVSVLVVLISPIAAVLAAGIATSLGVAVLVSLPHIRAAPEARLGQGRDGEGSRARTARILGALGHRQVRVLLVIAALDMVAFGCLLVAVSSAAATAGSPGWAGVLLGVFSAGAILGALALGGATPPNAGRRWATPGHQLTMFHAGAALLLALTGLTVAAGLVATLGLLLAAGLLSGPRDTLHQLVLGDWAPPVHRTEAFAWMSTVMWMGSGAGSALAGALTGRTGGGPAPAFLAAAAAAGMATCLTLLLRRAPRPGPDGAL